MRPAPRQPPTLIEESPSRGRDQRTCGRDQLIRASVAWRERGSRRTHPAIFRMRSAPQPRTCARRERPDRPMPTSNHINKRMGVAVLAAVFGVDARAMHARCAQRFVHRICALKPHSRDPHDTDAMNLPSCHFQRMKAPLLRLHIRLRHRETLKRMVVLPCLPHGAVKLVG